MNDRLYVTHCVGYDLRPLATVDGLPGGSADLRPAQMRALADALNAAADDCEALMGRRKKLREQREYWIAQI